MTKKVINDATLEAIADAIRDKNGSSDTYTPLEMPQAIEDIPTGGMDENLENLLRGTATGAITINSVTDLSATKINIGRVDGMNPNLTEIHMPELLYWSHGNWNNLNTTGGLVDSSNTTSKNSSARLQVLDIPKCKRLHISNTYTSTSNAVFMNLTTLNAPSLETISGTLNRCGLTELNLPNLTQARLSIGFYMCPGLVTVKLPKYTGDLGSNIFGSCPALKTVDAGLTNNINQAFNGCTSLDTLILRKTDGIATLSRGTEFDTTPIGAGNGYIYVPSALIDTYKAATNWSVYSSQFRAIEDYTVDGVFTPPTV